MADADFSDGNNDDDFKPMQPRCKPLSRRQSISSNDIVEPTVPSQIDAGAWRGIAHELRKHVGSVH